MSENVALALLTVSVAAIGGLIGLLMKARVALYRRWLRVIGMSALSASVFATGVAAGAWVGPSAQSIGFWGAATATAVTWLCLLGYLLPDMLEIRERGRDAAQQEQPPAGSADGER